MCRQGCIQGGGTPRCWESIGVNVHVRTLSQSVYTCVRASGSVDVDRSTTYSADRAFQMILDGVTVFLALPAGKMRAVVGNDQLKPLQHRYLLPNRVRVGGVLQAVQITLKDHLRRHLIHITTGLFCFLTCVA